jgi:hypothetical protein
MAADERALTVDILPGHDTVEPPVGWCDARIPAVALDVAVGLPCVTLSNNHAILTFLVR